VRATRARTARRRDVRRGSEWRAVSLSIVVDGRAIEAQGAALAYENSHHNCRDIVRTLDDADDDDVMLAIDGVTGDPDVCFSDSPDEWRLVLSVNGGNSAELVPYGGDVPR
jgi:hypothetical protein